MQERLGASVVIAWRWLHSPAVRAVSSSREMTLLAEVMEPATLIYQQVYICRKKWLSVRATDCEWECEATNLIIYDNRNRRNAFLLIIARLASERSSAAEGIRNHHLIKGETTPRNIIKAFYSPLRAAKNILKTKVVGFLVFSVDRSRCTYSMLFPIKMFTIIANASLEHELCTAPEIIVVAQREACEKWYRGLLKTSCLHAVLLMIHAIQSVQRHSLLCATILLASLSLIAHQSVYCLIRKSDEASDQRDSQKSFCGLL